MMTYDLPGSPDLPKLSAQEKSKIEFMWGVKVRMRDGVELNATIYRPKHTTPVPAIFTLTPYIGDSAHPRAMYFAQHGYAFLLVDCRGRGNSGGTFEPFVSEGQDGADVVKWLADQPWCDDQVTMWGGSYGGYDQWLTLKHLPPYLKTLVPVASAHAGVDFPFYKNIFFSYEIRWLTFTSGVTGNANLFGESTFWIEKFTERYQKHLAFKELDWIVGNLDSHFQTWMKHPTQDAYWDALALTQGEYDRINIPILSITGHYDGDQPGALQYYKNHMASASPARDSHFLIIGPWDHPGTRTPKKEVGGLVFGDACLLDMNQLHQEWYDWTMKGGTKPEFLKDRVAYYVTGADQWKYASSLETISNAKMKLFLDSPSGQAQDVYHSGQLAETLPVASVPDKYIYDPLDLRNGAMEQTEILNFLTDQRYELAFDRSGLVYHTAPFSEATEVSGQITATLFISMDVPDTDFQVWLAEITQDGSYILLTSDLLRARYRESLREEKLVPPGEIIPYTFTGFTFFSRQVAKGSRLRLAITCPNSIYIEKNYNSGGVVADETAAVSRTAHISLHHDSEHPSFIELPIVKPTP